MVTLTCAWSTPLGATTAVPPCVFVASRAMFVMRVVGNCGGAAPASETGEEASAPATIRTWVYAGPPLGFCQKNDPEPTAPVPPDPDPTVTVDAVLFNVLTGMNNP